ncbi:MAG: hypothetical protein ABIM44_05740 [candidate division WOR-3 bacterium]
MEALQELIEKLKGSEKEISEEEQGEKEEKKEEKKKEKGKKEVSSADGKQSEDISRRLEAERQINMAVSRFLAKYPFLADRIDRLRGIAEHLLLQDYNQGQIIGDFYSYLEKGWEIYRKSIESEFRTLQRIPVELKSSEAKEEEKFYTMDDYKRYYVEEYLPSIKKETEIIETHTATGDTKFDRGRLRVGQGAVGIEIAGSENSGTGNKTAEKKK